jgi:FlaA1/EpsC-like NDP-sugar epimerase
MQRAGGRGRSGAKQLVDAVAWPVGFAAAALVVAAAGGTVPAGVLPVLVAVAIAGQLLIGRRVGLYSLRWRYGTFADVVGVGATVAAVTALLVPVALAAAASTAAPTTAPTTAGAATVLVLLAGGAAVAVTGLCRLAVRSRGERQRLLGGAGREPVVVYGAGQVATALVASMRRSGPFHPVALLSDEATHRDLRLHGVAVQGDRTALAQVAAEHGAGVLVVAAPNTPLEVLRQLAADAAGLGLRVLTLPPVEELPDRTPSGDDVRPLTEADLLGRGEVDLDIEAVAGYLTGRRVLVTGAGGSIGSELCRQVHRFAPASLVMLDRDESALQAVQLSIEGSGLLDRRELVVCCIRDRERLAEVFDEHRPEVVFHAAALKHLPLLELHPSEGWKTNVEGTEHLLELSGLHHVERFVNISTDKAADPTSVLGHTKRVAEQLTAHAARRYPGTYLSVRFGNVLGSRGSVLPLFRAQIEAGGPVTLTHPDVTRYFMTVPEACQLVVQAGALDHDGRVMVLDMGQPVRIADVAQRLIAASGRPVEVVVTGLRQGEKLHEVLFAPDEEPRDAGHPLIAAVDVPPLDPADALPGPVPATTAPRTVPTG